MSLLSPQLIAFMAVVEHGTVHGAAATLHLTQTAVTQRIRTLESNLNTTLFKRSRRGMALSPEGETLLHYCQASHTLASETLAKLSGNDSKLCVELSICGPSSIMRSRIIPGCIPVMKKHPQLLLRFHIDDSSTRHIALRKASCDLAILSPTQTSAEMSIKPLKPEQYVLVGTSQWQGRTLNDIINNERIIDFDPTDTMTYQYLQHYQLDHLAKPERYFVNNADELVDLIKAGLGYSVLTWEFFELFAHNNIILLQPDEHLDHNVILAHYPRPKAPVYFQDLLNAIL